MEHSNRFKQAVTKLYNAFHSGELNAFDCEKCAVGNICNGRKEWAQSSSVFFIKSEYKGECKTVIDRTGYSAIELFKIERLFMHGKLVGDNLKQKRSKYSDLISSHSAYFECNYEKLKEQQFYGLLAVIEYLCELECIPNIMDYSKLFYTENDQPKYKLENSF